MSDLLPHLAAMCRRSVRHPLDAHGQPQSRTGAVPDEQRLDDALASEHGRVAVLRPGQRERQPARSRRPLPRPAGALRRTVDERLPAGRASGHVHQPHQPRSAKTDPLSPQRLAVARCPAPATRPAAPAERGARVGLDGPDAALEARIKAMETAFRMQLTATDAFDVAREPDRVRQMYGQGAFADGCLLARRLAERGVRFTQVYYGDGQPWDTHTGHNETTQRLAQDIDQPIAALLTDLKTRGLLDETLVIWGGEFGRTSTIGERQRPRSQPLGLHRLARRRRRQGRHGLRSDRRVRLPRGGQESPCPRPARDHPASAWASTTRS